MAVRRIGNVRPPDSNTIWGDSPHYVPGDIMAYAPGFGGQTLREAPGPIITEEHMAAPRDAKPKKSPPPRDIPYTKVIKPRGTTEVVVPAEVIPPSRRNINIRIPVDILDVFMEPGPGYQSRIVEVLRLFIDEGGRFVNEIKEIPHEE
jgi:uncharacterized protein (DUF4415 family)